jgi:hypothetical protein
MNDTIEVCNIRVYNKYTKMSYEHRRVPMEHTRLLAGHPNLRVEILSTYRVRIEDVSNDTTF